MTMSEVHAEDCDLDDDCSCNAAMLEHLQVLRLEPGDIIVLACPQDISAEQAARLKIQLEELAPGHRPVILSGGATIGAIRRGGATEVQFDPDGLDRI